MSAARVGKAARAGASPARAVPLSLQEQLARCRASEEFEVHAAFVRELLAAEDDDALAFHYEVLRGRENRALQLRLRAAFVKRGEPGARYLAGRIGAERDPAMRADLLHLLGRLRAKEALPIAREALGSEDEELRHHACCVLGWMGEEADVARLSATLAGDPAPKVRATAATAHSQLHDERPALQGALLASLASALEAERDENVASWIVVTAQLVAKKRFGLREDRESGQVLGALAPARERCMRALRKLLPALLALFVAFACGEAAEEQPPAPLVFSELRIEALAPNRAVVRFHTDRPATCAVEYGASPGPRSLRATDPEMQEGVFQHEHEVPLEDLAPETSYELQAVAVEADGREARSELHTFTTPAALVTEELPNVALASAGTSVASVSSEWSAAFAGANAIDGQMGTEWSSRGEGDAARLELALGQARSLRRVGLRSRSMADGTAIVTAFRLVTEDGTVLGPFQTPDPDVVATFELPAPVVATQVRFEIVSSTGGNTGLRELQLFAAP